ncbi:ParB-like chromosome segregation protein Spo0J [Raoultella sp. BIGb0138]|uniref:IbrB-like domain-containing protein n=1 Tax=Raoultella sp. BIGb0138 TaxID=2485115 RepID=UPI0010465AD5|nr:ParB/RepB/Spo0J family partition protein [Raoultella sp. BIGb0138]TCW15428.1 ParB-like chromosome segregation protein Spo0J [Raoultella sp. BIGb0138]
MRQQLSEDIARYLGALQGAERIAALNELRQLLHHYSPFRSQPVDCVLWVRQERVSPNDYNPNNLAPPEKRLLRTSLNTNGFTQPIVVLKQADEQYTIVDGFHRHLLAKDKGRLSTQLNGYLPVSCLASDSATRDTLMAATIRHNRARGRHQIHAMADIVQELAHLGWSDDKISQELGMDADEVLRLKQINGLLEMFSDRQFSQAWTVK